MANKAKRMRTRNREILKNMQARDNAMRELVQQQTREIVKLRAMSRLLAVQAYPDLDGKGVDQVDAMVRAQLTRVPCAGCPPDDQGRPQVIPDDARWSKSPGLWPPLCDRCMAAHEQAMAEQAQAQAEAAKIAENAMRDKAE